MQPISVEAFASMVMKNNKGYRKKELVKTLNESKYTKENLFFAKLNTIILACIHTHYPF